MHLMLRKVVGGLTETQDISRKAGAFRTIGYGDLGSDASFLASFNGQGSKILASKTPRTR